MLWYCWLDVRKSIQRVKIEWWGVGVVICLERGADCLHMVQLMPLCPKTPSSLASFKSRLVLPFWYLLTPVVLENRPLNGCNSSSPGSTCCCFRSTSLHCSEEVLLSAESYTSWLDNVKSFHYKSNLLNQQLCSLFWRKLFISNYFHILVIQYTRVQVQRPFVRDYPGEPLPER